MASSNDAMSGILNDVLNATGSRWGRLTFEKDGLVTVLAGNYDTHGHAGHDPWRIDRPRVEGRAVRGESYLPGPVWKLSDYYLSVLRPAGVEPDHSLVSGIACAGGEAVLFLARADWDSRYSAEEQARAEMFLPMVARTVEFCLLVEAERQEAACNTVALDALTLGFFVADRDGVLRFGNRAGRRMIGVAEWLVIEDGRLTTADPAYRGAFRLGLQNAAHPLEPEPVLIRFQGRNGSWATALISLVDVGAVGPASRQVLVTLRTNGNPDDRLPAIRLLFGLTEAEARLAVALVSGETVAEFAADRSVSINTARVQLTSLLRKTRTRRQAELVALLGAVPPVSLRARGARAAIRGFNQDEVR